MEEATHLLASEVVDLIILDIKLPQQSGLDLLKFGINLPPVIIISAYSEYALESYEIGKAADYLLKPYTYERLLVAVNRALNVQVTASSIADSSFIF